MNDTEYMALLIRSLMEDADCDFQTALEIAITDGIILPTDLKRPSRSGELQTVYVLAPHARKAVDEAFEREALADDKRKIN